MLLRKFFVFFVFLFLALPANAQNKIPAPEDVIGFKPGENRKLASWNQVLDYFDKLDKASDRVKFEALGKSTMDKPFVMATISAPENIQRLEYYKKINADLADPRTFKSNDRVAKDLIRRGKTIVLITCGIHSSEVGSYLSSLLMAHRLAASNEPEIKKILQDTIVLLVPSLNPDGVDIVKDWYDKTLGTPYEGADLPVLYHKYTGHDNNRDWYAFTQVETQITVDKIHNVWHPQIVHDIHQMGGYGARLWLPPYMQPVEPNVPKQIVEGYTELGQSMQNDMIAKGFTGLANDSIFDAWTPARAYSHYHGGVRILSETASCKLATPVTLKTENLRPGIGYDPRVESKNHPKVWQGGEWGLPEITSYMTTAAFALMKHASENRERWLSRFYEIGKEAVRPRKKGELYGFRVRINDNFPTLLDVLKRAGIEYGYPKGEKETKVNVVNYFDSIGTYPSQSIIIPLNQPYGVFAKALLEKQTYPNLKDEKGNPIPPYDVTAHTLSILMNLKVEEIKSPYTPNLLKKSNVLIGNADCIIGWQNKIGIYKSHIPSMDEGWTRWALGICTENESITDQEIRANNFNQENPPYSKLPPNMMAEQRKDPKYRFIIFPDQPASQILNGHAKGTMPDELTGGVGAEGVKALREYTEAGGTLIFLNRASNFAIEQFKLPVRDITEGVTRKDFYIPGSILRTDLDTTHPITKGMERESIAWFENSPVFEVAQDANVRVIARYPTSGELLLSGWALGIEKLKGKAALVEIPVGKGRIILFGFRPQYRGQSLATFPLLFNSITK